MKNILLCKTIELIFIANSLTIRTSKVSEVAGYKAAVLFS